MEVKLHTLGQVFDITNVVDQNIPYNTIIGFKAMNSGTLVIPHVLKDKFEGIDLSRRIPLMSVVEITLWDKTIKMYVEKADCEVVGDRFRHTLGLIDLKWILQGRQLPDFAITQPVTDVVQEINEWYKVEHQRLMFPILQTTTRTLAYIVSKTTNDSSTIDGRLLKKAGNYKVSLSVTASDYDGGSFDSGIDLTIELYIGGVLQKSLYMGVLKFRETITKDLLEEITTTGNKLVEVKIKGAPRPLVGGEKRITIKTSSLILETTGTEAKPFYYDEIVRKVIIMSDVTSLNPFVLDPSSEARLKTIKAHDDILTDNTMFSVLEKIANHVKAHLRLEIENNKKVIYFDFYDDMAKQDYITIKKDQVNESVNVSEYASGLELKNNNIINNQISFFPMQYSDDKSFATLRTTEEGTAQFTTENIGITLPEGINRIRKFLVRGKTFYYEDDTVALEASQTIDIADRIVEKPHYDVLEKLSVFTGVERYQKRQNNHLYYVRGDKKIYGMSGVGTQEVDWAQPINRANRALYETIACSIWDVNKKNLKEWVDGGFDDDLEMEVYIEYETLGSTNAVVLKDDQSGFQEKVINRLNANDKVNSSVLLGNYARTTVNSIGGTQKARNGYARSWDNVPIKGTVSPTNDRVISLNMVLNPIRVAFVITEVKDYIFRQEYIGIESDRRLYQIPKDDVVLRIDKMLISTTLDFEQKAALNFVNCSAPLFYLTEDVKSLLPSIAVITTQNKNYELIKKITLPITTNAIGTTLEYKFSFLDNYSAGEKRVIRDGKYYQVGVPYGDVFGNFELIELSYRHSYNVGAVTKSQLNELPEGHLTEHENARLITIKKDAREITSFSTQIMYGSNEKEVYIYDALVYYANMAKNREIKIKACVLNYKPNRDDLYIDLGRSIIQTNEIIASSDIEITLQNSGLGYAFFVEDTRELLIAVIKDVTASKQVLYINSEYYYK